VSSITAGQAATAASSIAHGVHVALVVQKITSIAAILIVTLTLIGTGWLALRILPAQADAAAAAAAAAAAPAPAPPSTAPSSHGRIQVGVTVSKWTAETNSPSGKPWGYDKQVRIVAELATAADLELYPVIEPGSETDDELMKQVRTAFPGYDPIDAGDPDALKHLDVIVAHEDWMVPDDMLKGVEHAVRDGVNLLNIGGMGWASPGLRGANTAPLHLTGFTEGQGGYTDGPVTCDVLAPHPILGPLGQLKQMSLRPLGGYGILPPDATPLMKVRDTTAIHPRGPAVEDARYAFYPIYISHLDKGRIVGLQFGPFTFPNRAERTKLLVRSVRWLAGRPVE
jgi:hypothetical protein